MDVNLESWYVLHINHIVMLVDGNTILKLIRDVTDTNSHHITVIDVAGCLLRIPSEEVKQMYFQELYRIKHIELK
jgi:hypothetical protein